MSDMRNKGGSTEMFSDDGKGGKTDRHLHEEILSGVSDEAHLKHRQRSKARAIKRGMNPKTAAKLYGC